MKINIAFSWPAGSGVNTAGLIVWNYLTKLWYDVYGDKEYQSIIKWWNNTFINYISDESIALSKKIDLFFAYDELAIQRNSKNYKLENIIELENKPEYFVNIVSVALFFKIIWLEKEKTTEIIKNFFWNKIPEAIWDKNLKSIDKWYEIETNFKLEFEKNQDNENVFVDGNYVVAESAVKSWLSFYSAYPMTPASTLINYITKHKNVEFFQWEDEIAVAMSMLWARFAGKKAMCGTSGGGFALMSETISFANQAEIWWIYVLSQRAGPSTWTPTFTEQGDILYALNSSFWDTKPIVVYPADFETTSELINKVFYWADIYQHPIIVLLDKQFSESYCNIAGLQQDKIDSISQNNLDKIRFNEENKDKFLQIKDLEENKFLRYQITDNGISPYTYPSVKNWEFIASSYEHTESGATTEDTEMKKLMTEKRHKKMETFVKNEFNENFYGYEIFNENAKKFFITMWINKITINHFIEKNPEYGLIVIKVLQPLDMRLKDFIESKDIKELIFVELNYSGQLEEIISSKLWLNCEKWKWKIKNIRKYNNLPLFIEDLKENTN